MAGIGLLDEFGGSFFGCCEDVEGCCYTCFCPPCAMGEALSTANQGPCVVHCVLISLPCIGMMYLASKVQTVDTNQGGDLNCLSECCILTFCPCEWCRFTRAVARAREKGVFAQPSHKGAPQAESAMAR